MEDKNINNQVVEEKEKSKPKSTINLTVQEFVILGLCLILTAVIVACNCIYSIPVATVQTSYATSNVSIQENAIETVATVAEDEYTENEYSGEDEGGTISRSTSTEISTQTSNQTSKTVSSSANETTKTTDTQKSSVTKSASSSPAVASSGLININTADVAALCTLNGIGEVRAKAIITYRDSHGSFTNIEQLKDVENIGDKTFDKIKDYVTIK